MMNQISSYLVTSVAPGILRPISTFLVTSVAHMVLRLLVVIAASVAAAWVVSRLSRMTCWFQCLSLLLASFLFLDSDAQTLAVIVLVSYKVVLPLAWWSWCGIVQQIFFYVCEMCELVLGISLGLLYMILKDRSDLPPGLYIGLALLLGFWLWKKAVPRVRRALVQIWKIVAAISCAAVLALAGAAPMVTDSRPLAAIYVVLGALYLRWLSQQIIGYLQERLPVWLYTIARVAAAVFALCLAVILYVWFATVSKQSAGSLWTLAAIGNLVWVCATKVGPLVFQFVRDLMRRFGECVRAFVRVIVIGYRIQQSIQEARRKELLGRALEAHVGGGSLW